MGSESFLSTEACAYAAEVERSQATYLHSDHDFRKLSLIFFFLLQNTVTTENKKKKKKEKKSHGDVGLSFSSIISNLPFLVYLRSIFFSLNFCVFSFMVSR